MIHTRAVTSNMPADCNRLITRLILPRQCLLFTQDISLLSILTQAAHMRSLDDAIPHKSTRQWESESWMCCICFTSVNLCKPYKNWHMHGLQTFGGKLGSTPGSRSSSKWVILPILVAVSMVLCIHVRKRIGHNEPCLMEGDVFAFQNMFPWPRLMLFKHKWANSNIMTTYSGCNTTKVTTGHWGQTMTKAAQYLTKYEHCIQNCVHPFPQCQGASTLSRK